MKVALVSKNRYLWQKLKLLLPTDAVMLSGATDIPEYDRLVWDSDTISEAPLGGAIIISRENGALSPAFSEDELILAVGDAPRLTVNKADRTATLDARTIKLTEVEFSLLSELMAAGGEYVCRKRLIERVWGSAGNDGLINVYIHYLREKLETGAERMIFSSRKEGYRLIVGRREPTNAHN